MGKLGNTWRRIAQMGWDERRTRAAQEIHRRSDLFFYRVGLLSNRNPIGHYPAAPGKFFFSPAELPDRVSLFKSRMSVESEAVVREADQICNHRFKLLGYEDLDYGKQIDWHFDAVHGKRAPAKPWFKIHFLDFEEAGDHKVIWELNRHQHLVTLAKAWGLTQERRYVDELQTQWYSWQRDNPYPIGINWGSSLEVGVRSISWIWGLSLLSGSQVGEANFRRDVIRALALNGRYIERYLSTYFSPNTHLLGEAAALFFTGTLFPEIASANRWQELGWRILDGESRRQVRPDGVYFEQSLYYHVYALDFFLHARILAGRNGIVVPSDFDVVLNKMLDVVSGVSQAGVAEGFGDDDGGRVFDPRRNRTEHMTDPLALGAVLFQRADLKGVSRLTEEAFWLFGEQAVSFFEGSAKHPRQLSSAAFVDGGIYVMAGGVSHARQMVIDAGPQGTGHSGHGHADALSVSLAMDGQRWLVDSGAFCYLDCERDRFRGTAAHNTVRIDGLDQGVPDGLFAWKAIPEVRCDKWIEGKSFTLFEGNHTGYVRLSDPVLHRRCVFYSREEFWIILDIAEGKEEHQVEINWHFGANIAAEQTEDGCITFAKNTSDAEGLALFTAPTSGWKPDLANGDLSPAYGRKENASIFRLTRLGKLPAEHATLFAPGNARQIAGKFSRVEERNPSVYCYESLGKEHYTVFADPQKETWNWNRWSSDARFFYFRVEDGIITDLIFCDGREVRLNGLPVIAHPNVIQRFEWNRRTGQVCSSDESAGVISTQFLETFSPA